MNKFKLLTCLLACMAALSAKALVTGVRYGIAYDVSTCRWSMYMKVTGGTASTNLDRTASTAKLTLVVAATTTVGSTVYANEPKFGSVSNGVLTRTSTPSGWTLGNKTTPLSGPLVGYSVYDYNVNPSGAYYDSLKVGDSVTLFSLDIGSFVCGADLRLWNNNVIQGAAVTSGPTDPTSANLGGKDYNNGISISNSGQRYTGNNATKNPPSPTITGSRTLTASSIVLSSTVTPGSSCATISSYEWIGPNGFFANTQNAVVTPISAASFGTYSIRATDAIGCSANLTLASIALPVKLTKFVGIASKCNAILNWQTAAETSFDRFELQYSTDGESYMTVGQVSSKKQAGGSDYTYSYAPASGKGYYRLKMIDLNGTFAYSETVTVQTSCGSAAGEISISPNPTSGNVSVRGIAAGTEIRIMDMVGKVVANEVSTGASITFDLSKYANGIYNVLVSQNGAWEKVGQIVKN